MWREASYSFAPLAPLMANWRGEDPPYTPAMRRFVCVAALLLGFSGDRYAWTIRVRVPVPVTQPVRLREVDGTVRGPAWWMS